MAISDIYNTLTFGGVNSGDYGIYITGEAVYNAPARAVEMIQVPGRNGDIALDLGHYENLNVDYPAGVFAADSEDFARKISEFRNAIVSQKGYQRLSDTYNPDEYRMALYSSGLEVNPVKYNSAGEFTLSFNCKPQRWLTEGETEITVASGGTLTNPTLYESSPLIAIDGSGTAEINGTTITLNDGPMGKIVLASAGTLSNGEYFPLKTRGRMNPGDAISATNFKSFISVDISGIALPEGTTASFSAEIERTSANISPEITLNAAREDSALFEINTKDLSFEYGGPTQGEYFYFHITIRLTNGETISLNFVEGVTIAQGRPDEMFFYLNRFGSEASGSRVVLISYDRGRIIGDSTASILGNPTFIDSETGVAYKFEDEAFVDLNAYSIIGAKLPFLRPGENLVSFGKNITSVKIVPRWWKL